MKSPLRLLAGILPAAILALMTACSETPAPAAWNAPGQVNPIVPGYYADPSYVEFDGKHYIYATLDPWGSDTLGCWESPDFKNWTYKELNWPTRAACKSKNSNGHAVWAPSVVRARDGKFYMYISVGSEIWAGAADHPLGPWRSITPEGMPLVARNWGGGAYHNIDAEAFIDDDGSAYLYWGSGLNWTNGHCFVAKLKPDMASFDGEPRDVTPTNYFEGPFMVKHAGKYYLTYSEGMIIKDTYEVRYAVGDSPFGPFKEAPNSPILATDHTKAVVSPGHHAVFYKDGKSYILYHRMTNPYVKDTFTSRELCVDSLNFMPDGLIAKVEPTHSGPAIIRGRLAGDYRYEATASSVAGERFAANNVADDNYSTRWMPAKDAAGAWLQLDFGKSRAVGRQEIRFEYAWKKYRFTLETSEDGQTWTPLADFTKTPATGSPVVVATPVKARYLRMNFPASEKGKNIGVWEWLVTR